MTPYLTTLQAAAILEVTDRRVRQMVAEGVLAGQKLGRDVLVEREAVQALDLERRYPLHMRPYRYGTRYAHIPRTIHPWPPTSAAEPSARLIAHEERRRNGGTHSGIAGLDLHDRF